MTVRTTISMPDEIWDLVEARQKETGASTSEIVRRALSAFFDGNGKAKTTRPAAKRALKPVPAKPAAKASKRPAKRPATKTA